MTKGISDVIAMLLMLIITIGLVGLAYSYITGIFTSKTAVVLTIDPSASSCTSDQINIIIRNEGNQPTATIKVMYYPPGSSNPEQTCQVASGYLDTINPYNYTIFTCTKTSGAGMYRVVASAAGVVASSTIHCSS
ncbi:MAG: hypothetical protein QXD89_02155 [Candidatus Aenigmatarchaeota archaeon]